MSPTSRTFTDFTKLDEHTHLHIPPKTSTSSTTTPNGEATSLRSNAPTSASASPTTPKPPSIIILSTWMSAQPKHITKYITGYRILYPTTPLLLLQNSPLDILFNRNPTFSPAVSAIKAACSSNPTTSPTPTSAPAQRTSQQYPQILLHAFSNGGGNQALRLLRAYQNTLPPTPTLNPFPTASPPSSANPNSNPAPPLRIQIFDSCPGRSGHTLLINALSTSLPNSPLLARWLLMGVMYVMVSVYGVMMWMLPGVFPDVIERVKGGFVARGADATIMDAEIRRLYIYSKEDKMVPWDAVEEHARLAEERGFMVRREIFGGTEHCAHVRGEGNEERYWRVVEEVWEGKGNWERKA